MPGDVTRISEPSSSRKRGSVQIPAGAGMTRLPSAAEAAAALAGTDFSGCSATVVGYGKMGREYVKALRALKVRRIRVCSRSPERMRDLEGVEGISLFPGGYEKFLSSPVTPEEPAILAVPVADLCEAARRLARIGYRKMLIEKPVSLRSEEIEALEDTLSRSGVEAAVAYNRTAYPSLLEARFRARQEGGITSCFYTFTEFIHQIDLKRYAAEELRRWGIANSLHVIGMAHRLIGLPRVWRGHRSGGLEWHPSGSVFVGSGLSEEGIPFGYHADWGSTGRWSVELHTAGASYRLMPLERLQRKASARADWEPVPVPALDPGTKAGFVEEVAAMLDEGIGGQIPPVRLKEAAALTRYGEQLFGYS